MQQQSVKQTKKELRPGKLSLAEHKAKKEAITNAKQSNWQKFASKNHSAINSNSIFKAPTTNNVKVGICRK